MKLVYTLAAACVLITGCSTSSKPDSSKSDSTAVGAAAVPTNAPDTTIQKEATAEAEQAPREYPSYLPWDYAFYGISKASPAIAAFEQSGLISNNASPQKGELEFYVVDVEKNNYVGLPYFDFWEGDTRFPAVAKKDIQGILRQYNLPDSNFRKTPLVARNDRAPVIIKEEEHELTLTQSRINGKLVFELQLRNVKTGRGWLLQKDQLLPSSRGEVTKYSLKDAYVREDDIAVIIHYERIGGVTEGKQFKLGKYLIVTGSVSIEPSL